ncbi:antiterminator LoaP [Fictibacillus phosphorivorans]|uniref:antiterminator LoaP n=1 Tax=Fictibacillus phosphorivorans TaxID=1221500 RepID=UPI003CE67FAF
MNWYALYVETGKEDMLQKIIRNKYSKKQHIETLVPKRVIPEKKDGKFYFVKKKMFPGYIFIKVKMDYYFYYTLKGLPNFFKVLSTNHKSDYFTEIPDEEMSHILPLLSKEGELGISELDITDSEYTVTSGPLKGHEQIIKKINKRKKRAKIELNFLGTSKTVDVGIKIINIRT